MENSQGNDRKDNLKQDGEAYLLPSRVEEIEHEQAEAKKRDEDYKDRQLVFERKLVWFTGCLVLVGLIGAGIAIWQSVIAQRAADAARSAADTANAGLDETRRAAGAAIAATNAAERANELSERILNQNLERARLERRAWVGISSVRYRAPLAAGERFQVSWRYTNTGSTPALKVRLTERVLTAGDPCATTHTHSVLASIGDGNVVLPGAAFNYPSRSVPLPPNVGAAIEAGSPFYAYGRLLYDDVFGVEHETTFCAAYQPAMIDLFGPQLMGWCSCHNAAN